MLSVELTESRTRIASGIFRDIAQVFFASMVVTVLISSGDWPIAFAGLIFSIASWLLSLLLIK